MTRRPGIIGDLVLQGPVLDRAMLGFPDKPQDDVRSAVAGYREAHGIAGALLGKASAIRGIPQVASLGEFRSARFGAIVAGSGTVSVPASTEWKPRRMQPGAAFHLSRRHEEGTRQIRISWSGCWPLYSGRSGVASVSGNADRSLVHL
jgi:hypothetical protein